MASFNKVFLMGNLTRDPEVRTTPGGLVIAKLGLAVNRRYRTRDGEQKEETVYIDIDAFGVQAETIQKYCNKGSGLFIEGRLRLEQWQDKSGENRSKLSVVMENFQFTGGRGDAPAAANPRPARDVANGAGQHTAAATGETGMDDDDVPF
jgi:single-strand DNA-binding protein